MTNAELTILSLIVEQPRHGYQVEQAIEERGMREWTGIGFSSIYYILDRLEKQGLVESEVEARRGKGPNRRLFRPTEAGCQAHREAVYQALSTPQPSHPPFMLGLAGWRALNPEEALTALTDYRSRLAERLIHVTDRYEQQQPLPDFVAALFERTQVLIRAELDWLDRFIQRQKEVHGMPSTLDLTKLHKQAYVAKTDPEFIVVPDGNFLTVHGQGAPGEAPFNQAVEVLYSVSYTLKFKLKAAGKDFKVGPLEGLWYGGVDWQSVPREEWAWKLMIRQPDFITPAILQEAIDQVVRKKRLEGARQVRLERVTEGEAAQVMHLGPYSEELATIDRLHAFIAAHGCEPMGAHHEIYLSDPKRSAPEKLKTILRHPVKRQG